jgi:hypothetical protein
MIRTVFLASPLVAVGLFLASTAFAGTTAACMRVGEASPSSARTLRKAAIRTGRPEPAAFASIVQKIAFVDKPDQECVAHYQKRLQSQLSRDDVFRKYGATGTLRCLYIGPHHKKGQFIEATANYTCADDVLTTNLHNFVDFHSGALLARPSQCSMVVYGLNGEEERPVKPQSFVGGIDVFRKGLTNAERKKLLTDANTDWAVLKTGTHATDVTPYVVYDTNPIVATNLANRKIISASAPESGMQCESVSVYCSIQTSYPPQQITRPRGLETDCDFNHGASGGADLQKIDGRMAMVGVHGEGDQPNGDENAVWYKDPSKNKFKPWVNASASVLLERDFLDAVKQACGADHIAHLPSGDPYDETTDSEPPTIGHK